MKLQVGEKVRFLNEAIEGIVTKILNNERVEITDEYGFTHAAPEKYLVRIEFHLPEKMSHYREQEEAAPAPKAQPPQQPTIVSSLENDETLYSAISLINSESPLSSDIELRLINNCSSSIVYTVAKKADEMRVGIIAGVLNPKNEIIVGVYAQDELHRFDGFVFQFLFFNSELYKPRPFAEKALKFSSTDFVENDHWETMKFRDQKTLLKPLFVLAKETSVDLNKLVEKYKTQEEENEKRRKSDVASKGKKGDKFVVLNKEKVVDLHIDSLIKDYSGMSNSQIIVYQLNQFLYEMDQGILNHLYKITFIHGVGEGILKSAIREELKKFTGIKFGDAPVEKFGFGATEVMFS